MSTALPCNSQVALAPPVPLGHDPHLQRHSTDATGTPAGTALLTPDGWTTFEAVRAGDQVVGSQGTPTTVTDVFTHGVRPTARVVFADGSHVLVGADHPWPVRLDDAEPDLIGTMQVSKALDAGTGVWSPVPHPVSFAPRCSRHAHPLTPVEAERLGHAYQAFDETTYRRLLDGLGCEVSLASDWRVP
ncbi:MAG: hypothetical protein L0H93_18135, partial [Nocardioides sp.]|nr:hypothetical protein [Nocardioides sp.]